MGMKKGQAADDPGCGRDWFPELRGEGRDSTPPDTRQKLPVFLKLGCLFPWLCSSNTSRPVFAAGALAQQRAVLAVGLCPGPHCPPPSLPPCLPYPPSWDCVELSEMSPKRIGPKVLLGGPG